MFIAPISVMNSNVNFKNTNDKKVTNPIQAENKTENLANNNGSNAISAYFKGGMAISFKGFDCSTGNFVTKELDNVPCCCCGGTMVLNKNLGETAKEFSACKGDALAEKIRSNQDYFRTTPKLIANLIADTAEGNPEMDMGDAMRVIEPNLKELSINYCVKQLKTADEIAKTATGSEQNPISALINSEIENVQGGKIDRVAFTEKLSMYEHVAGHEAYDKILESAMNIPESFKNVKQRFGYAYGNAKKVAKELLKPSMQTIEHIHPKSQGGPNATQNYIAECYDCNNPRGHMSYAEWLKIHPEYPINAQKHIEYFQQQMVDGKIDERYDSYPVEVRETLSKESDGRIVLKVLNPERIKELRDARMAGQEVNIHEEIEKEYKENKKEEIA